MHGSSVVSTHAFGARGPRFNPCGRLGKIWVFKHAFICVICSNGTQISVIFQIGMITDAPVQEESPTVQALQNWHVQCAVQLLIIHERLFSRI